MISESLKVLKLLACVALKFRVAQAPSKGYAFAREFWKLGHRNYFSVKIVAGHLGRSKFSARDMLEV